MIFIFGLWPINTERSELFIFLCGLNILIDVEEIVRIVFALDLPKSVVILSINRLDTIMPFFHQEIDVPVWKVHLIFERRMKFREIFFFFFFWLSDLTRIRSSRDEVLASSFASNLWSAYDSQEADRHLSESITFCISYMAQRGIVNPLPAMIIDHLASRTAHAVSPLRLRCTAPSIG